VQWLLIIVALVGALWLGGLAVMGYLQVPQPGTPHYRGFPMPSLMLVGGVLVGILLALLCRFLVTLAARARARSADQRLRAAITEVTDRLVVEPVQGEIAAYRSTREGLTAARG
jgi:hypothetical protein